MKSILVYIELTDCMKLYGSFTELIELIEEVDLEKM